MSVQIFISYRRDDSSGSAGRLCDRLIARFGGNNIFMDVDSIDLGENFVKTIGEKVESCDVLIAVIGKGWLTSCDQKGQRRLDNPDDIVRLEIATALKRDIRVIPVLVDGALMARLFSTKHRWMPQLVFLGLSESLYGRKTRSLTGSRHES